MSGGINHLSEIYKGEEMQNSIKIFTDVWVLNGEHSDCKLACQTNEILPQRPAPPTYCEFLLTSLPTHSLNAIVLLNLSETIIYSADY